MRARYKPKKVERLNLIPIMGAVFIFIFFLLMSAQFVQVFEIGSSVPMVREVASTPDKKDPLNLILEITEDLVIVKTGSQGLQLGTFSNTDWEKLRDTIRELKVKHPEEKLVILRPHKRVPFKKIVKVIDHTKGDPQTKQKFFEEIVFDGRLTI